MRSTKKFSKNGRQSTYFILTSKEAHNPKIYEIEHKNKMQKEKENWSRNRFEALQKKVKEKEQCKFLKAQFCSEEADCKEQLII